MAADRILMYHRQLNGIAHARDLEQRDRNGFDHFTVTLLLGGDLVVETAGGATFRPRPGEVLFMDVAVPSRNQAHGVEMITLSIARDRMLTLAGDPAGPHGLMIDAGCSELFGDIVKLLPGRLKEMTAPERTAISGILTTILSLALDRAGFDRTGALSPRDAERVSQFRRRVDARLSDPRFGPAEAVREAGLSRASVYRLLKPHGGVAKFLRDRRLERVRMLLSDTGEDRPLAEIIAAAGLPSASYASRRFLNQYSVRPARYRDLVQAGDDQASFKLRFWQNELR